MTAARFVDGYLSSDGRGIEGYPSHYGDRAARADAVARAAARPLPPERLAVLRAQNARWPSPARDAQLDRLAAGAACVVTGQQVGLCLGPLYTVYKAASAIRTAAALEAETGHAVVPVFWLQTEDHDFAEAAEVHVPDRTGRPVRVSVPADPAAHRVSLAHRTLGPGIEPALAHLAAHLDGPHAATHLDALGAAYRPDATWPEAFAALLADLFGPEGLVIVDPRDPGFAPAAGRVHARALEASDTLAEGLAQRSAALAAAGLGAPVSIRPGAPLSFFHPDGPEGPRYRLAPEGRGFRLVGRPEARFDRDALLALAAEPLRFSTSALLRPILQDSLLPTAAYVGGPGEIDYFAQLPPVYAAFDLPPPLLVPRHRFRVVTERTAADLDALGLPPDALAEDTLTLLAQVGLQSDDWPEPADTEAALLAPILAELEALGPRLAALEPRLERSAARTSATVTRAVGKLMDGYRRALLRAEVGRAGPLRRARQALRPNGGPQERLYGLSAFAAQFGARPFVEGVLRAAVPYDGAERTLRP